MILTSQKSRNYATSLYSSSLSTFDNSRSRPRPITLRLRLGFLGVPCGLRLFYSSFDFVSLTVPRPSIPASPPLAVIGSLWQHIALSIQASLTLAFIGAISFAGDSMSPSRNRPLCLHCRSAIAGFLWRTASHLLRLRLRSSSQETACLYMLGHTGTACALLCRACRLSADPPRSCPVFPSARPAFSERRRTGIRSW